MNIKFIGLWLIFKICIFAQVNAETPTYGNMYNVPKRPLPTFGDPNTTRSSLKGHKKLQIVNGKAAALSQFPYQVHLLVTSATGESYCGGSITILPTIILSAAHCVKDATKVLVTLGEVSLKDVIPNKLQTTRVALYAKQWVVHEGYVNDGVKIINDIALLQLPQFIFYNKNILPIVPNFIPPNTALWNTLYVGKTFTVSGWGKTSDASTDLPTELQFTTVQVIKWDDCAKEFSFITASTNIICVKPIATTAPFSSSCQGDSGGPLMYQGFQFGAVSFGSTQCEINSPSAYTSIQPYWSWMVQKWIATYSVTSPWWTTTTA